MTLTRLLREKVLILDGGIGTEILRRTGKSFDCPEILNLECPDLVLDIHKAYIDAGADIITTNTFGASRIKLKGHRLGSRVEEINAAAVRIAKKARKSSAAFIAGSMGPTGQLIRPLGPLEETAVYNAFAEQAKALAKAGVVLLLIETQIDLLEAKIALRAVREHTSLPAAVSMTFPLEDGRTVTGSDPEAAAIALDSIDVNLFGINCGGHPQEFETLIKKAARHTDKPLIVYANAGIPEKTEKGLLYPLGPEDYAEYAQEFYRLGANVIGGCCGTTPDHIRLVARRLKGKKPVRRKSCAAFFQASSRSGILSIGHALPFRVIGENINPFGRKALNQELEEQRLDLMRDLARRQELAGAHALDVNLGKQGEQSPEFYGTAVRELQAVTALPLFLDNSRPKSLESALAGFAGKAVLNSVNGKEENLETLFPLAKKHGAAVVLLALDAKGIPETAAGRVRVIQKLYRKALDYGFSTHDLIADPIVLTIATSQEQAKETLSAIAMIKDMGLPTILGLSNLSFGLPQRRLLNQAFLAMALEKGLDAAILNPLDERLMALARAGETVIGRDPNLRIFLETYGKNPEIAVEEKKEFSTLPPEKALFQAVVEGEGQKAKDLTAYLLSSGRDGFDILEKILSPAMRKVGDHYERRRYFLPQLILSAKAMEAASGALESFLNVQDKARKKIRVVMATVEGDLHDIGKNIVSLVLRNSGCEVIDLGKNVSAAKIIHTAIKEKADIIGLSALMTTTMDEMKNVLRLKQEACPGIKVIIGGAAVTPSSARAIGADAYGKDAMDTLKKVEKISGQKR